MYKHTIPSLFPLIAPSLTWKVNTDDKVLYLTFDDGPHPRITPLVLRLLERFDAKATFFCVGENVQKHPATYREILSKGHKTGNHTYNHLPGWSTANKRYFENTARAATLIDSKLFRPPYGRISPSQIRVLKKQYRIVMWSILTRDYDGHLDKEKATADLLKKTGKGDVVVFHDSERAETNMLYILEHMLVHFSSLQFRFDTL